MNLPFQSTYTSLPPIFYKPTNPTPVKNPSLILFNHELGEEFNLDLTQEEIINIFSGNTIIPDSKPISQAYAGHQFGNFTMLGDGRAILLGELLSVKSERKDIQLKGSGRTSFSRGGDGRATLSSMLREYIISEAMYHMGIPTSRSLCVISTGEPVYRDTKQEGAILTRVASSHIRVGTFEYAYQFTDEKSLSTFVEYTIQRHYPECLQTENSVLSFFKKVIHNQLELIIHWLRIGFIHGVMNTDNMTVSGETIDYGPCAFMNSYNPSTVFSSIDIGGRYAFGSQAAIAQWNLACLANSLLPLIDKNVNSAIQKAQEALDEYSDLFNEKYWEMMGKKVGISSVSLEDRAFIQEFLDWMFHNSADYTNTFLVLELDLKIENGIYSDENFLNLKEKWNKRLNEKNISRDVAISLMQKSNPCMIPRNHKIESALQSAVSGDLSEYKDLLKVLKNPYIRKPYDELQLEIPIDGDFGYRTFCGT